MKEYKKVMLVSPNTVKGLGLVDCNFDDALMGSAIRTAQSVYLRDVIGDALLERLQELVFNAIEGNEDNIDTPDNEPYKVLLEEYIEEALARKTVVELCLTNSFKMRNIGVAQDSDVNIKSATLSDIKYIRDSYETLWNDSLNRLIDFLKKNKTSFPEIDACACGDRLPKLNNKYGNTKLWLGD